MEAYKSFAMVYDEFMDNIPYEEWAEYIIGILKENGIKDADQIADLGCGTGSITEILAKQGYNMTGIDLSEDMLMVAQNKLYDSGLNIVYSNQDMCDFQLPYEVNACVCVCDSVNYLTEEGQLADFFKTVHKCLLPGGILVLDMKTEYFYKEILGENTIAESRDDAAFIWDNYYYEDERINEYVLTLFIQKDKRLYEKYEEMHYQKAFDIDEVKLDIKKSGLKLVNIYDAFTKNAPDEESERIYLVIKKEK